MASMRDIQRRKASVESTGQITKAMKLVSTVKLQKARGRAETAKPYFNGMFDTVASILARSGNINHRFLKSNPDKKKAVIVITSNRGLAGGYNSNVVKLLTRNDDFSKDNVILYTIGRKGKDSLSGKGYEVKTDYSDVIDEPLFSDAMKISQDVLKAFVDGEIGEIYLAYTVFKNTVSHVPTMKKLLPVSVDEYELSEEDKLVPMNFEPGEEEVLDMIIPKYISSLIFGALVEAVASENGARMTAMDSATSNADEMISNLSLLYNRARQGSITQELTEIIAGAEAIS
ncbi:MAG: ATP synthase F1 subunit gamma [Lachnospiraceae bacterium]|nr:ATP synthase F1 subunit gamma [Lachnospiraceae bacterium]